MREWQTFGHFLVPSRLSITESTEFYEKIQPKSVEEPPGTTYFWLLIPHIEFFAAAHSAVTLVDVQLNRVSRRKLINIFITFVLENNVLCSI